MSGLIPRPFIDDLLHRTDLVELIDSFVPLKKRGNSYLACCPFHQEKSPSFNVVAKKQFYHCFGCGASGNAISFVMNYLNQSFTDAIETLAAKQGLSVPREGKSEKPQVSQDLYQLLSKVNLYYQQTLKNEGEPAIHYLRQRGLSGEVAKRYQLGFANPGWHNLENHFRQHKQDLITTGMLIQKEDGKTYDRYRNRIMFPIHDRHGRIIGFGGRTIEADQKPKYLNSPETVLFQKSRELYGLHQIISQDKTQDSILVVEGYMDVIALAQHGVLNAVATLGTATSTFHIQLISKHTQKVIFCFDGDEAGRQAAWRALESSLAHLNQGLDAYFMFLPEGQDPDSLVRSEGKEGFLKRLQEAQPLPRFFFNSLSQDIQLNTPAGRTQLINQLKPYFNKMGEGPYQELLMNDLSRITHLEVHRLKKLLAEAKDKEAQPTKAIPIQRTPVRIALALILQHPDIFKQCLLSDEQIASNLKQHEVLHELITLLVENPDLTTAQLIEHWRESPYFESINKLAAWDHQVPELEITKELLDTLRFLQKQTHSNEINYYLEKSRKEGLNAEEQQKLLSLLKQKHLAST